MRFQGRISDWNAERGFGFLTPNGGGNRIFAHISQFPPGQPKPTVNELVSYETKDDGQGKIAAVAIRYVTRPEVSTRPRNVRSTPPRQTPARQGLGWKSWVMGIGLILGLIGVATQQFNTQDEPASSLEAAEFETLPDEAHGRFETQHELTTPEEADKLETLLDAPSVQFSCDGRDHCSEMTSCAEAEYFLQHCPFPQMDGDGDGRPCEQQWCH